MITDSPYESGSLVLKPLEGILAGLTGALAMMGAMFLLHSYSLNGFIGTLTRFGAFIPGAGVGGGALLLLFGGGVMGLLYALCEQRIPTRGLIGDGLFYGFFLWVLFGLILGAFGGEPVRSLMRTWVFLIELLVFGLSLSIFSLVVKKYRSASSTLPRD